MDAVQAMGIQGGWPLNLFLTPDQKPFYAGTYFPPQQWYGLIQQVGQAFVQKRADLESSAGNFAKALRSSETQFQDLDSDLGLPTKEDIELTFSRLSQDIDKKLGGTAPQYGRLVAASRGEHLVAAGGISTIPGRPGSSGLARTTRATPKDQFQTPPTDAAPHSARE